MTRTRRRYGIWSVLVLAAWVAVLGAAGDTAPDEPAGEIAAVHTDPQALVDAVLRTTRAFLYEDGPAARAGLDGLEAATRRLDRDRDAAYDPELLNYDQAFHMVIDRARELSSAGELEEAFNQFVWVQRGCITCHGLARQQGLPAPGGSLPLEVN